MSEDNCDGGATKEPSSTPASSAASEAKQAMGSYMKQLLAEKQKLEGKAGVELQLTHKLLMSELERLQGGARSSGRAGGTEERRFADIIKEKPIKVTIRVLVPVKEHPKFNFVGKLLGPKGNSLKRLQEDTMTKMAILGRGSMRDKHKEEELRASADPKYAHFNDDLHVEITAFAPPAEAHARIAYALAEVRKFLVPDYNDEIRQEQMREMQLLNTAVLGLAGGDLVPPSSPATAQSPTTSPPPGKTANNNQNGRQQPLQFTQQNGRNYLYNQQFLLHPAFRGLTARAHGLQIPGIASVFHAGGGGSILNRLRPHHHLAATPGINAANNRLSPSAVLSSAKHQRNNILSILAGGPRSVIGGTLDGAPSGGGSEQQLLATMCDDVMVPAGDDEEVNAARASTMYGLYENYAAAAVAAAASGTGYGLLEGYANGNGVLTAETMEDITAAQEAVNGTASADLTAAARSEGGAVKIDRARYRHDPYGRYTGVKLPL